MALSGRISMLALAATCSLSVACGFDMRANSRTVGGLRPAFVGGSQQIMLGAQRPLAGGRERSLCLRQGLILGARMSGKEEPAFPMGEAIAKSMANSNSAPIQASPTAGAATTHCSPSAFPMGEAIAKSMANSNSAPIQASPTAGAANPNSPPSVSAESDNENFEVTWEHADGTSDVMQAYKLDENPFEPETTKDVSLLEKAWLGVKNFFVGGVKMDKQKMAALGTSALLSYGFVSNFSYVTCLICAWVVFGHQTGLSPLAAGQWPRFLAVYAGFWAFQNIVRPARFAVSVAIAPQFDRFVDSIQTNASAVTGRKVNKATAFGIVVFLVNLLGTCSYLVFGLALATKIAGVPFLPPKV